MHLRRVSSFVLGAWIAGSLLVAVMVYDSSRSADSILQSVPQPLAKAMEKWDSGQVRQLVHYQAAELARTYLARWELMELALGAILLLLLVFSTRVSRLAIALCAAMMLFAAFAHFILRPEIDYIGKAVDLEQGWSGQRARYLALQGVYSGLQALKILLGCVLAGYLFVFKTHTMRPTVPVPDPEQKIVESAG